MAKQKTEAPSQTPPKPQGATPALEIVEDLENLTVEQLRKIDPESIPAYRRCRICWGECKGVGIAYGGYKNKSRTYYKCKKALTDAGGCGHTWYVDVEVTRSVEAPVDAGGTAPGQISPE